MDLALSRRRKDAGLLLPGLGVTLVIAVAAFALRQIPMLSPLSPLIIAVLIGLAAGSLVAIPAVTRPGIAFAGRRILRIAIVLLGFQLSAAQIASIGLDGLLIVIAAVAVTFPAMMWAGRLLGVDARLAGLLAAGTSICGASAVAAMSTVNRAADEDVTYAISVVTVFGTLLMFALPVAAHALGFDARAFGLWSGASIHEIAQVTGAAFQFSDAAGEAGIVVKLTRVLMLAPLILVCGLWLRSRGTDESVAPPPFPLFVLGFVAAVAVNSFVPIPADMRASLMTVTTLLMAMALAALGLQTHVGRLKAKGLRPMLLGALGTAVVTGVSLALILLSSAFA